MVILQHGLGVIAALIVFATIRRAAGPGWLALVSAAGLLLDRDETYLEHNIMGEGALQITLAGTSYAAVRTFEDPCCRGDALLPRSAEHRQFDQTVRGASPDRA